MMEVIGPGTEAEVQDFVARRREGIRCVLWVVVLVSHVDMAEGVSLEGSIRCTSDSDGRLSR